MAEKEKDEKVKLQKYLNRIEAGEKFREPYLELWKRCYKRWRNYVDKLIDPKTGKVITDRSNISIPYIFVQVETILPRLVETLFAARPYVSVRGREPNDQNNAENMETLLDWQMNERIDIKDIFASGLKKVIMYGTGVAYTGWKYSEHEVIKKQLVDVVEVDEQGNPVLNYDGSLNPLLDENSEPIQEYQPLKTMEIENDDPEVQFLDLGLFYVDPNAIDIEDARYCGHVEYKTKEELLELEQLEIGYKFDWDKIENDDKTNEVKNERLSSVGLPTPEKTGNNEDKLYEVIHYWEDDKHVVIINRSFVALDSENPFWHKKKPYVKDVYTEVPDEFYGMGVPEMLEDLQDELNTERNMRIDYKAFTLRRMFKVRRGTNINKDQLRWRQGGIIEIDNMDDIEEFGVSSNLNDSFNQEAQIKNDMQDTSGAFDIIMGTSDSSETATSTMTKDNNASIRFKHVISSLEKRLLVGVSKLIIQNNQQFIDDKKVLRVTGESGDDWVHISPDEIQGQFDLIPMGSSVEPMANKEAFKQRMIELYNVMKGEPLLTQFPDKKRNLLKKVLDAFDIKDIESILPSDDELGFMQQAQAQIAQEKQLGNGANTSMTEEYNPMLAGGPIG